REHHEKCAFFHSKGVPQILSNRLTKLPIKICNSIKSSTSLEQLVWAMASHTPHQTCNSVVKRKLEGQGHANNACHK
ncbi:hypothetical protein KI387_005881, partial [Taxus chinensis]